MQKNTPEVSFWEYASIKFLFRCLKTSKGLIVDVGAQVGSFTLLAKFLNTPFLAIEADNEAAKHLEDNLLANGLIPGSDFHLLVGAASSSDGIVKLNIASNHRGLSNIGVTQYRMIPDRQKEVKTFSLDNLDLGPISAIKMDIEGGEYEALKGGSHLLFKHKPMLFIEWSDENLSQFNTSTEELKLFLKSFGYNFFFKVEGNMLCSHSISPRICAAILEYQAGEMLKATRRTIKSFVSFKAVRTI